MLKAISLPIIFYDLMFKEILPYRREILLFLFIGFFSNFISCYTHIIPFFF